MNVPVQIWIAAGSGGFAVFVFVLGVQRMITARQDILARRLSNTAVPSRQHSLPESDSKAAQGRVALVLERATRGTTLAARINTDLRQARVALTVGEYLTIVSLVIALGILLAVWSGNPILGLILCFAGWYGPRQWVHGRKVRRVRLFNSQLADMILMLVNSMRAGNVINKALADIAPQCPQPMSTELSRVVKEMKDVGISLEEALNHMLESIDSSDLRLFISALAIQRDIGSSDIISVLQNISETIRSRVKLSAEVASLTAQQRYSGYIVALLPVGFFGIMMIANPHYILNLFATTIWCGWTMFGLAVVMLIAGVIVIGKLVDIKV